MNLLCEREDLKSLQMSPVFILTTGRQLSSEVISLLLFICQLNLNISGTSKQMGIETFTLLWL